MEITPVMKGGGEKKNIFSEKTVFLLFFDLWTVLFISFFCFYFLTF